MTDNEFTTKFNTLYSQYPNKLKVIRSESDVRSIDMFAGGMPELIDDYEKIINYISGKLSSGNKVAIQGGARKGEFIVYAARSLF